MAGLGLIQINARVWRPSESAAMTRDPRWYRDMAAWWRDFAALGPAESRDKRLRLADEFEALADRIEREGRQAAD